MLLILNRHQNKYYFLLIIQKKALPLQKKIMKQLKVVMHLSNQDLFKLMRSQKDVRRYQELQIIYAVQTNAGTKSEVLSSLLGVSKSKIFRTVQAYNKNGLEWHSNKPWGGRREERSIMTLKEEKQLLSEVEGEALKGEILIYKHLKEKVEGYAGRTVSDDYIWDLFKRHGWKKKSPRPSHPKAIQEDQDEYKKNFQSYWQPNH
jgi:transposase